MSARPWGRGRLSERRNGTGRCRMRESPQTRMRCACRAWTSARECYRARYNDGDGLGEYGDEECGCYCHDLKGFTAAVPVRSDHD